MANFEHVALVKRGAQAIADWRVTNLDERLDLTGAYLSGANLSQANLSGANLYKADLTGAYLRKANLSEADLSRANLYKAYLTGAYLTGAYLTRANLYKADLAEANLTEADLSWVDLSWANLYKADLTGANLRNADLREADLSKANLYKADLSGANLSGANLSGANVNGAYLIEDTASPTSFRVVSVNSAEELLRELELTRKPLVPLGEAQSKNSAPAIEIYLDPGHASKETIQRLFECLSDLHRAAGGIGLDFRLDGTMTVIATEARR